MPRIRRQIAANPSLADKAIQVAEKMLALGHDSKLVEVLDECLGATRRYWVKTGDNQGEWCVEPDFQTRIKAVTVGMSYLYGLPPQRSEVMQLNASLDLSKGGVVNLDSIQDPAIRAKVSAMLAAQTEKAKHVGKEAGQEPAKGESATEIPIAGVRTAEDEEGASPGG